MGNRHASPAAKTINAEIAEHAENDDPAVSACSAVHVVVSYHRSVTCIVWSIARVGQPFLFGSVGVAVTVNP